MDMRAIATDADVMRIRNEYPKDSTEWRVAEQLRAIRQYHSDSVIISKEELDELVSHIRTNDGIQCVYKLKCRGVLK